MSNECKKATNVERRTVRPAPFSAACILHFNHGHTLGSNILLWQFVAIYCGWVGGILQYALPYFIKYYMIQANSLFLLFFSFYSWFSSYLIIINNISYVKNIIIVAVDGDHQHHISHPPLSGIKKHMKKKLN